MLPSVLEHLALTPTGDHLTVGEVRCLFADCGAANRIASFHLRKTLLERSIFFLANSARKRVAGTNP
ncbi:MAG: hypothetical protein JWN45_2308 [Acidobacteriaceae bacterium]|nr:hypothetical protein [Acidobacteriaceae bacterium]